ncbi:MAG: dTMP kinase [Bacillota bacterium]
MGRGRLIVLEGIDGSGITTQAQALGSWLSSQGHPVLVTKEPTCGPVGKLLRQALSGDLHLDEATVALLFAADRHEHVSREVLPALEQGIHVISDRYYLSSLAYQSSGLKARWLAELNTHCPRPDLTVFLDVPSRVALARVHRRGAALEIYEQQDTLERVRSRYHGLIQAFSRAGDHVRVVDGADAPSEVTGRLARLAGDLLSTPATLPATLRDLDVDWEGWQ